MESFQVWFAEQMQLLVNALFYMGIGYLLGIARAYTQKKAVRTFQEHTAKH